MGVFKHVCSLRFISAVAALGGGISVLGLLARVAVSALRATVVRVVLWVAVAYFTAFFLLVAGLIGHPSWAEPLVSEGAAKIREVVEDVRSAPGGGGFQFH